MTETLFSSTTTPLTPPKMEEDRLSWLRLFRSKGVGPHTFQRLMAEHGSAQRVLDMLPELAGRAGVTGYEAATVDQARYEMRAARKCGAVMVCMGDPAYPDMLNDLSDAPPVFWAFGNLDLLKRPMVALVGARNASGLGERMAKKLAGDLGAAGMVTVSGLARGIDAAVHAATLETGTVAVLGGGVDVVYPNENRSLFEKIAKSGLRISEQPMGLAPQARHFPRRNRLISGLGRAVIVIEAAAKSGSLITARNALDQGRDVGAVPGHPFDARASGTNLLLRDGATLVRGADDVLEMIGSISDQVQKPDPVAATKPKPAARSSSPNQPRTTRKLHADILARLGPSPLAEDQLIRDLSLTAGQLAPALMDLEISGDVTRHSGGLVSRNVPTSAPARH